MPADVSSLSPMQAARRGLLAGFVFLALATFAVIGSWTHRHLAHEAVEIVGLVAILACIIGRCWSTLYIGGRKGRELVAAGPYSLCRNPLYTFSILGAFGFGAQTGSLVVGGACALVAYAVFRAVVGREEAFLKGALGEPYLAYLRSTPRFMPDVRLWRNLEAVEVLPGRVARTFLDGLMFLTAIPIAEGIEQLQGHHWLPILLQLP